MIVVIDRQRQELADQSAILADAPIVPFVPHCEDHDSSYRWDAQDFFPLKAELTPEAKYHFEILNISDKDFAYIEKGNIGISPKKDIFITPNDSIIPHIIEGYDSGGQYYQYVMTTNIRQKIWRFRYGDRTYYNLQNNVEKYPEKIQEMYQLWSEEKNEDCRFFHEFMTIGGKYSIPWEDPAVPEERRFMLEEIFKPLYEAAGIE